MTPLSSCIIINIIVARKSTFISTIYGRKISVKQRQLGGKLFRETMNLHLEYFHFLRAVPCRVAPLGFSNGRSNSAETAGEKEAIDDNAKEETP